VGAFDIAATAGPEDILSAATGAEPSRSRGRPAVTIGKPSDAVMQIAKDPAILRALSPIWVARYFADHGVVGTISRSREHDEAAGRVQRLSAAGRSGAGRRV
jgi:hypothetical protein